MAELILGPAIALGAIIGLYEATIVHRDVQVASHRFGHTIHAFLLSIIFVFAAMNVEFVLSIIPALNSVPLVNNPHMFRVIIGLIAAIKIHGVSKAIQGMGSSSVGLGETWFHSLLVGGLIIGAPYAYPVVEPALPAWVKF